MARIRVKAKPTARSDVRKRTMAKVRTRAGGGAAKEAAARAIEG